MVSSPLLTGPSCLLDHAQGPRDEPALPTVVLILQGPGTK